MISIIVLLNIVSIEYLTDSKESLVEELNCMKKSLTAVLVLFCSTSLVGCANLSNQDVGTVTGGIAGGLLGSTVGGGSGRRAGTGQPGGPAG